jgi:peroxiredoxin
MGLSVGSKAPDFALTLKPDEAPLRLSDYRGERKVVLLFFPAAFSPVCTEEMCAVAENYDAWQGLDAEVIAISSDTALVNQRFAEETDARFPILSDYNKEVSREYDALHEELRGMKGVVKRAVFVIDRDGTITYAWEGEHPGFMPDLDEVMEATRAAD